MSKLEKIFSEIITSSDLPKNKVLFLQSYLFMEDFEKLTDGRFTSCFIKSLIQLELDEQLFDRIIYEIKAFEQPEFFSSRTKLPSIFKHDLQGLWHKHYQRLGLESVTNNLKIALKLNDQPSKEISKICHSTEFHNPYQYADEITKKIMEKYFSRSMDCELTGEWIIYHIHNGKNYYLTVGKHTSDFEEMFYQIKSCCKIEFPEFSNELPIFEY